MMERRNGFSKILRAVSITLALAGLTVATTPSAHAVSWFYKFVCEDLLHYFDHSVKRVDKAIEKFQWAKRGFLELGSEGAPGGYGLLLKQYYENYFRECETLLEALAAMAKRAIKPEQAEIVRLKLAEMRSSILTPREVNDSMNWVIAKMSKVGADPAPYVKMKEDYQRFYEFLHWQTLDGTRVDPSFFLDINERAFLVHFERTKTTDLKGITGVVNPSFAENNPMYDLIQAANREILAGPSTGASAYVKGPASIENTNKILEQKWFGRYDAEIAKGNYKVVTESVKAIFYEGLKTVTMGDIRSDYFQVDAYKLGYLVDLMTNRMDEAFVRGLGVDKAKLLAKNLDDYSAAIKKLPSLEHTYPNSVTKESNDLTKSLESWAWRIRHEIEFMH